ncbi:MAG: FIST N-terminal domain-containing protein [Pseudomonadota bacterium]
MTAVTSAPPFFALAVATDGAPRALAVELARRLRPASPSTVLFFAHPRHDFAALAARMQEQFPEALTVGCTTLGEIGPCGFTRGAVVALGLGSPCRAAAALVPELTSFRFEDGAHVLDQLRDQLGLADDSIVPGRHVLITLLDGLSGMEELVVAAIGTSLPAVSLVGGSAGDDLRLIETQVAVDGRACAGGAVVLLLEPSVPFHPFQIHHFEATSERVVVTRADPQRRVVQRLNGRPAAQVLADLVGVPLERLRSEGSVGLALHGLQFGFHAGSEYYLRAVMKIEGEALIMAGAVEEGAILTLMRSGDMLTSTRQGIARAIEQLGARPAAMLLFNCGGRLFEAEARGQVQALFEAQGEVPAIGFTTYGEQFGPMLLNQTLTGLLLGWPHGR